MNDIEIGYLAGIIDGEGCITITRQKPGTGGRKNWSYRLYLKVTMGHRETVDRLREMTGVGSVHEQKTAHWNTAWSWIVSTRDAQGILELVRPHLITKAIEADLALEWCYLPLAPLGGRNGGKEIPQEIQDQRHRLFVAMKEAKPSYRFRKMEEGVG